jgi:hypothetical protein
MVFGPWPSLFSEAMPLWSRSRIRGGSGPEYAIPNVDLVMTFDTPGSDWN